MFDELKGAVAAVRGVVARIEPSRLSPDDAARLVEMFSELERLASAGRTLAGRRVERSYLWHDEGFRTPAQWMASKAQTSLSAAITTIQTGRRLEALPYTREAFQGGLLSSDQAAEIAAAAHADPAAEKGLLETARAESVTRLKLRCREVVAAASADLDVDERIHRSRYLRHWSDPDGAVRVDARLAPDSGARFVATIDARANRLHQDARKQGSPERVEAHAADALVALADQTTPAPKAIVHVHVDHAAWNRGHTVPGESCMIPGIGPVPVPAARRLASDGIVKAVLREEADVRAVSHLGRQVPARLRSALEARDQTCAVPGCDRRDDLEIHHTSPYAETGHTRLDELARVCAQHHKLLTHRGWKLDGRPGAWRFYKPKRGGVLPSRE